MNSIQTISVTGMTCQNCVRHVREALEALPDVRAVEVDLHSGRVRLVGSHEVPRPQLQAALAEAGYSLT